MTLAVTFLEVGRRAHGWDEQNLQLLASARQISDAPTGGLTSAVRGAADAFLTSWHRHVTTLAEEAESTGDDLRGAVEDYMLTDDYTASASYDLSMDEYAEFHQNLVDR